MFLLKIVIATIVFIQPTIGNKAEAAVAHDQLNNDDLDFHHTDNGSDLDVLPYLASDCSENSRCTNYSLDHVLANLTNNSLISIVTDLRLSSIIPLVGFANISVIGHNNPTVHCNKFGGLHIVSCYNCTIQGITWEECGARNIIYNTNYDTVPVLQLYNSSKVTIKDCSFQHSIGQAVVLSGVSGDININHCNFLYSKHYRGHGSAIYYSSIFSLFAWPLNFIISKCTFSYNEDAKSLVYFGHSLTKMYRYLRITNSDFHHNKGVPIYISNQNLYLSGNIKFYNNTADNGGGIFIANYSNVIFYQCAQVQFSNNMANNHGGAIFLTTHSSIIFEDSCTCDQFKGNQCFEKTSAMITFDNNKANEAGGAIYAYNSNIGFQKSTTVRFTKNKASFSNSNGAIYVKNSNIHFKEFSVVTFIDNSGAMNVHQYSSVTFEGNSMVTFSDNKVTSNGGAMNVEYFSIVRFTGNSTVKFSNNKAVNGDDKNNNNCGAVYIGIYSDVTYEGNSEVLFDSNIADNDGGSVCISYFSTITFKENSIAKFSDNGAFRNGGGIYIYQHSIAKCDGNSTLTFSDSTVQGNGGAVCISHNSVIMFDGNSVTKFIKDNGAYSMGGAMYMVHSSSVIFEGNSTVTFDSNIARSNGGALYVDHYCNVTFKESCTVAFHKNAIASDNGGALSVGHNSIVIFEGNSTVEFYGNVGNSKGGALYLNNLSHIAFKGNSVVIFNDNLADNGAAMYISCHSTVMVNEHAVVTFNNNLADNNGRAIYIYKISYLTFEGNSRVSFDNNKAAHSGGAVYIQRNFTEVFGGSTASYKDWHIDTVDTSNITFTGNSSVIFYNNTADHGNGGHLYIYQFCIATFKENAMVTFNTTGNREAVYIDSYSIVTFEGNSRVSFDNHKANNNGGAMYIDDYCLVTFKHNSLVTFNNNRAGSNGGAVYISSSIVTFTENSTITFSNNAAGIDGGAIHIDYSSIVIFDENFTFICFGNIAGYNGGAICIDDFSNVTFKGNSTVTLNNNGGGNDGGALHIDTRSVIKFEENSSLRMHNNKAAHNGGAISIADSSNITFKGNCVVAFYNNLAEGNGGALNIDFESTVKFKENSLLKVINNQARSNGGAVCIDHSSNITVKGNSILSFSNNIGYNGGAMFISQLSNAAFQETTTIKFIHNGGINNGGAVYSYWSSFITLTGKPTIYFLRNIAVKGGAAFTELSDIKFAGNSSVHLINNTATQDGGAIYLGIKSNFAITNNSKMNFYFNSARDYGGAIYVKFINSSVAFNISSIDFKGNNAGTSKKPVYINVPKSCNHSCLFHRIKVASKQVSFPITTSPSKLILYKPTKCINGNDAKCNTYYIDNIMLGQDIAFDACVLDGYDQPAETTQFSVAGFNQQHHYNISGSKYISVSCNRTTQGIHIIGNLGTNNSHNYTIKISSYVARNSESKMVSVYLTIRLTQCHPGFWYFSNSRRCECYDNKNIISCSNSSSTIKRGYWFGFVTGKPTVTQCPINYCNFTCCEIANGIYHLSPVRANQCRPHRSGTACGNCEEGYTLSFDSDKCVEVSKCTIGQMALVITMSFLYLIVVVVAVFAMMHFKVPIGSLYGIIYYYSILDILLSQDYYISSRLYTTVSIVSSFAKLTPRFLGQLCLVENMSGIDQQFIHYVYPVTVSLILVIIRMLARRSRRITSFISKGIIHFIWFLLLLSYTSVVNTSLLLMRSLTFINVDRVYTYLSPDIEYFHGRHLAYIIVAAIFTTVIVVGLPLLLALEPYLSSKVNFIKIMPLLDQFQESYKNNCRCFAAYYMICRIIIIVITIARIFDDFTTQYLLISTCALIALIHLTVRPYKRNKYNIFDGIVLQLIVIVSLLQTVKYFDSNYNASFLVAIAYLLTILPLVIFILVIHNEKFLTGIKYCKKKIIKFKICNGIKYCFKRCSQNYNATPNDDMEVPISEINTLRRSSVNVTVVKP